MKEITGVYETQLKNGTPSFRAGITVSRKHISLGSYNNSEDAGRAYTEACELMTSPAGIDDYSDTMALSFRKYVSLVNLRDNHIYFKSPIYLFKKHFMYYVDRDTILTFDADDLFYYSTKSIMKRGNHLFVADYGMQVNILSRYGIREHAVLGRDYYFVNDNRHDFRYGNIVIINKYYGVRRIIHNNRERFKAIIHINGDYVIGTYNSEDEAAIAYNKAAHILREKGVKKSFPENYPESLSAIAYASIYNSVKISARIRNYTTD